MAWFIFMTTIYAYSIHLKSGEYHLVFTKEYFNDGLGFLKTKLPEEYKKLRGFGYLDSELYDNFIITKNEY